MKLRPANVLIMNNNNNNNNNNKKQHKLLIKVNWDSSQNIEKMLNYKKYISKELP